MLAPLAVAGVVMFAFLTFPPLLLEVNSDTSLSVVLDYASAHRSQFGPELVSTYGPLGFLVFPQYSHYAPVLRTVADVLSNFTVAAGLCLIAWRLRWVLRCALIGIFLWTASNVWLRMDLVLQSGLFFWGLLCLVESGRRLEFSVLVYGGLAAFCALAKVSLMLAGALGLTVVILRLVLCRRPVLASGALLVFAISFLCGWVVAGQSLAHIGTFLQRGLSVARSYNAALGVEGMQAAPPVGFMVAILAVTALTLRCIGSAGPEQHRWSHRILVFGFGLLFAFSSWKHGFVRGDTYHIGLFLGFVPLLMLALQMLPATGSRPASWGLPFSAAATALALFALQFLIFRPLPGSLTEPYDLFRSNLRRLFKPGEYRRSAREFLEAKARGCELPQLRRIVGGSAVDVFGQHQAYALYNGLNYRPRPVFQSYNACNAELAQLNHDFFFSESAPAYWLFHLSPMDRKFASLEDARLLGALLINGELVAAEKEFLLLKRRSSPEQPRLTLLREGSLIAGQPLDLRPWNSGPLWLELSLEPTALGQVRQLVYRLPTIRLAALREPGGQLLYRHQAPAPMLAAGFLASPLVTRTADVLDLYSGTNAVQPGAYAIELRDGTRYWRESIRFRLYRIENRLPCVGGA